MIFKLNKFIKTSWFYHNKSEIISMRTKDKNNKDGDFWDFLLGFGLGSVGMFILSILSSKPNCPVCKTKIEKGKEKCPNCNTYLSWKQK